MFETAYLKIDRAAKHIAELNELFRVKRPFTYILETDTNSRHRATFAKKDETTVKQASLIAGDAVHNLRSALDHAYFELVSPHCTTDRERRAVQFPFSETAARLQEAVQNRLAGRVGQWLADAIIRLKPYSEHGGNELLALIHDLDVTDKHRLLIPAADYTQVTFDMMKAVALDFPMSGPGVAGFGMNKRDFMWPLHPGVATSLKGLIPPNGVLEQEISIPVQIVFAVGPNGAPGEFIQTLHLMVDAAKSAVEAIRPAP